MRKLAIIALVLVGLLLAGCFAAIAGLFVASSGHDVTREWELADFDTVEAGDTFNVEISRGKHFKVAVTADANYMDYVQVTKEGSVLHLALDPSFHGARSLKLGTLEARITMPDLRELRLSGASHTQIDGFTQDLDVKMGGASWLNGMLAAGSVRLDASGASNARLEGSAQEIVVHGSGASHCDLAGLRAGNGQVDLSGASSAEVEVKGRLDYGLSGGSHLEFEGDPRIGQAQASGGASASSR